MTSDPDFQISGFVIGESLAVVSLRWVNVGQFMSQAWSSGVLLAKMVGWSSVREHQAVCTDAVTINNGATAVLSAAGDSIAWRTSHDVAVGANTWHEGQLVFPVSRS